MATYDDRSPEEKEVNKHINEAKQEIAEIEKEMNNLGRDHGPRPELKIPGGPASPERTNAERIKEGKERIETIKNGLAEKVDKTLANSSREVKEKGQSNLSSFLYPTKENERHEQKDISASQAFATKLRYDGKGRDAKVPDHERTQVKDLSSSQQFAMKLKQQHAEKQVLDKGNADKTDKDKSMSMSFKFSHSLSYTRLEEQAAHPDKDDKTKADIDKSTPDKNEPSKEDIGDKEDR